MSRAPLRAIVVDAARGTRHLDPNRSYPTSLKPLERGGRVLDWLLHALKAVGIEREDTVFVGGYHLEKVVQEYPGLQYYFHAAWEREDEGGALALAAGDLEPACIVLSGRVLFRPQALEALLAAPGVGARASLADGQPVALAVLRGEAARLLAGWVAEPARALEPLDTLLDALQERLGLPSVAVGDHCAALTDRLSLSRFVLGSKAQTLERFQAVLRSARVLDQVRFTVGEWVDRPREILAAVNERFPRTALVVRSSASIEDSWTASHAGRFSSILDVDGQHRSALNDAIETVIEGYREAGVVGASLEQSEVFVQPFLKDVAASGVVLTRDLDTGAPYFVVTLDRTTGRTDGVTSGSAVPIETHIVYRGALTPPRDPLVRSVLELARELETLTGHDSLDVEFAAGADGALTLLQVRPLVTRGDLAVAESDFHDELAEVRRFSARLFGPHPRLSGATTVLSNMTDWNPAEMIGAVPRPLALSLYQVLITDNAWAEARKRLGYHDVTGQPLLVALGGVPYVDVRASLNSFVPAGLNADVRTRLVDASLRHLKDHPALHDKVEFEVAVTSLAFDFDVQAERLRGLGVSRHDVDALRDALLGLTDPLVRGEAAVLREAPVLREAEAQFRTLASLRKATLAGPLAGPAIPAAIRQLATDGIRFGTVPFSILARAAFISMAFLKSLVRRGVFSPDEHQRFLRGIPTVAGEVLAQLRALRRGETPREEFVERFGHLRPGTYDLLSSNYAESLDAFAQEGVEGGPEEGSKRGTEAGGEPEAPTEDPRELFLGKEAAIAGLLREHGFRATVHELLEFVLATIPGREAGKFEFTKNVNAILELVAQYGRELDLTRDHMSHLSIERLLRLATDSPSAALRNELLRSAGFESKRHELAAAMRMPPLLGSVEDLECFLLPQTQPNYVTGKRVRAPVVDVGREPGQVLRGRIALIRSADPGYDWIFSQGVVGLVTQFGGAASHMAIRAAEFGLPSVIGCGEAMYAAARRARVLELDCASQTMRVVQ